MKTFHKIFGKFDNGEKRAKLSNKEVYGLH